MLNHVSLLRNSSSLFHSQPWLRETLERVFSIWLPEVESRTQGSRPRPRTQKKIRGQGQGQPFRGQTLSRPRTGMLEAKAKDQAHRLKSSQTKIKIFKKAFQEISNL